MLGQRFLPMLAAFLHGDGKQGERNDRRRAEGEIYRTLPLNWLEEQFGAELLSQPVRSRTHVRFAFVRSRIVKPKRTVISRTTELGSGVISASISPLKA